MERGMDLHEALTQISEIRQQVARTETFRGFRAAPVAFSGLVAWFAAYIQFSTMPVAATEMRAYLGLWVGAALLSIAVTGLYMFAHCWRSQLALTRSNTALALGQFVPSVA